MEQGTAQHARKEPRRVVETKPGAQNLAPSSEEILYPQFIVNNIISPPF